MTTKIFDKRGKLKEIQKDGETIWREDEEYIKRSEIGETTAQMLRDAETVADIKQFLARVCKIDLGAT